MFILLCILAVFIGASAIIQSTELMNEKTDIGTLTNCLLIQNDNSEPLVDFIKGLLLGLGERKEIDSLIPCIAMGEEIIKKLIEALILVRKNPNPEGLLKGLQDFINAMKDLIKMLEPCIEGFEKLTMLMQALAVASPGQMLLKIIIHRNEFTKNILQAIESYSKRNFEQCGKAVGELCKIFFFDY